MKLSIKASLLLSGIVLAVIAATSLFLFDLQRKSLKAYFRQSLEAEAASLAVHVRSFAEENLRDMAAVAGNLPAGILGQDPAVVRPNLERQLSFFPRFDSGLFVLDGQGHFLADYPEHPELTGQSFEHREYFQQTLATGRGVVGAAYVSQRSNYPVITFTAPVRSATGRVEYVVCGSVNLLSASALGEQRMRRVGRTGYVYIVDKAGRFIIHPDNARVLKSIDLTRNQFLVSALEGFEGVGETVNSSGTPMFVASRRIPELGWTVIAQMPATEVSDAIWDGVVAVAAFFVGALVVVLPLGFVLMRRIARPLEALEKAAHIIANDLKRTDGALTRPFASSAMDALRKMRSNDEIGRLARAFFQLSVRLKQTLASLRGAAQDWERTFSSVQEAVFVLDADGRVLRCNRAAEGLLRSVKADILGRHWRDVLAGGHAPPRDWPGGDTLRDAGRFKVASRLPDREGHFELAFSSIQGRRDAKGYLLIVTDATEKLKAEERIRDLAFHDPLTGLPNRLLLFDRLEQAIATAERNGSLVGVLFLDLDDFKQVNDTLGHDSGDELLRQAARRLGACLRSNDTLSRLAGDEFVSVLMDLKLPGEATAIAARMLESLGEPFDIAGRTARIGASIGIALYPRDGVTPEQLVNHADTAMYRAKGSGKNSFWLAGALAVSDTGRLPSQ